MSVSAQPDTGEKPVCPECRDGKHWNCDTTAWDDWRDKPTHCRCWEDNHERSRA